MIQNKIKEYKEIQASELVENPNNAFHKHSKRQKKLMKAALDELGFAAAAIVQKQADGKYLLIDGHLRKSLIDDEQNVPCLVLNEDVDPDKILLSMDTIGSLGSFEKLDYKKLLDNTKFDTELLNLPIFNLKNEELETEEEEEQATKITANLTQEQALYAAKILAKEGICVTMKATNEKFGHSVPMFKYTGAKRKITDWIWRNFSKENVFEPYAGSAAVTFQKPQNKKVNKFLLNDISKNVINFYRTLKHEGPDPFLKPENEYEKLIEQADVDISETGDDYDAENAAKWYWSRIVQNNCEKKLYVESKPRTFYNDDITKEIEIHLNYCNTLLKNSVLTCIDAITFTEMFPISGNYFFDPPYNNTKNNYDTETNNASQTLIDYIIQNERKYRNSNIFICEYNQNINDDIKQIPGIKFKKWTTIKINGGIGEECIAYRLGN